jgi:purine catabolism regulator
VSAPTVKSLVAELGRHLRPAPGFEVGDAVVSAVHISDLPDPTAYLTGGELLLTTGLSTGLTPATDDDWTPYVARLAAVGVVGIGFGLGPVHDVVPTGLTTACHEHGVALLVVPEPTPFITISRAYWTGVARSGERALVDQLGAQRALVDAAASDDPARAIVRTLSKWLPGWAAALTPEGEIEEVAPRSARAEVAAVAREAGLNTLRDVRSSISIVEGGRHVVVFPLGGLRLPTGYLAVGTARRVDPVVRRTLLIAVALLGLALSRSALGRAARDARAGAVAALLDAGMPLAARRLAVDLAMTPAPDRIRVAVLSGQLASPAASALTRWCTPYAYQELSPRTWWAVLPSELPERQPLVDVLSELDPELVLTISGAVPLGQAGPERIRRLALLADLPSGVLDVGPGPEPRASALVERLVQAGQPALVDALVGYLRHRGQWEAAARDLGTHRNTLRYRLERVRSLLAVDVDEPDVSATLWLELRSRGLA